jgi:hypothetical protein
MTLTIYGVVGGLPGSEQTRETLAAFLTANSIDPSNVPMHAQVVVDAAKRTVTVPELLRDEHGMTVVHGNEFLTREATYPLLTGPDPFDLTDGPPTPAL